MHSQNALSSSFSGDCHKHLEQLFSELDPPPAASLANSFRKRCGVLSPPVFFVGWQGEDPNTILSTVLAVLAVILQDARAQRKHSKGTRLVLCLQVERPIFYRSMVICGSHLENAFWKTNSRYPAESFSETVEFEVSDLGMFIMLLAFCLHTNLLGMEEHAHS